MLRAPAPRVALVACTWIAAGLMLVPDVSAHLSIIRQQYESSDFVEPGDRLGRSLAAGDFNGDGIEDLAMGAPEESEDVIDVALHGAVCINYGTSFGLTHLSPDFITIGGVTDLVVRYGYSLAAGDFDNDGYDDLAVGAPYLDDELNGITDGGAVYIFRGGALGLESTPDQSLFQTTMGGPPQSGALFGWSLAAGDFNNDAYDDLAVGAIGIDSEAGEVFYYFFTSNNGIQVLGQGSFQQSDLGHTDQPGSQFGWALVAAPFDAAPGEDLAIGAPGRTLPDLVESGRVYAVPGSPAGFQLALATIHDRHLWGMDHDPGDRFGHSLTAGRFVAAASLPALVVGEPGALIGSDDNAGRVSVRWDVFGAVSVSTFIQSTGGSANPDPGDQFGYALAAGDLDADGFPDLAIGSPFENVVWQGDTYPAAGMFQIYPGGPSFPLATGATAYTARNLNDAIMSNANLGRALAFGHFDDSGRANLAIGAPDHELTDFVAGDDIPDAGQVHILAPHRQIANRENRASIGIDCTGNIIYSQRMFHPMPMASITKMMTVLLACEAIDEDEISEGALYTVPDWLAVDMPYGSLYGVVTGEKLTLKNLMALTMAISANDCAWAIGDLLTGSDNEWDYDVDYDTNIVTVLSGFANRMNIRADEIGMTRTTYSQPAGSNPGGSAWTCAYDQYLLAREAMMNARFRDLAGTANWAFLRDVPGMAGDTVVTFSNGFLTNMKGRYSTCDGVKPGSSTPARKTGVASAPIGTLRIFGTVLGVLDTKYGDPIDDSANGTLEDLLELVDTVCDSVNGWPGEPPPGSSEPPFTRSGIPTHEDSAATQAHVEAIPDLGDVAVQLVPASESPCAEVTIHRVGETAIPAGDSRDYSFEALESHLGFRITNRESPSVELEIALSHPPGTTIVATVPRDSSLLIPPYAGPPGLGEPTQFTMTVANVSPRDLAVLDVEEKGYRHSGPIPPLFVRTLNRQPGALKVAIKGCDTEPGGSLFMVIQDADQPVLAAPAPGSPGSPPNTHLMLRSAPNPFHGSTEFSFELAEPGPVRVRIYDLSGRLVQDLRIAERGTPGSYRVTWDGRNLEGRQANGGMYLYHVRAGSASAHGKVTLLR